MLDTTPDTRPDSRSDSGSDSSAPNPLVPTRTAKPAGRRLRSGAVSVAAVTTLAGTLTACGASPEEGYAGVCVDPGTLVRTDDDLCDDVDDDWDGVSPYAWYWLLYGRTAPAVGAVASGGSLYAPDAPRVRGGVPLAGGSVAKAIRTGFSSGKVVGRSGFLGGGSGFGG